jgi:pimeloyl-ACP methyl ester carboxylesterase
MRIILLIVLLLVFPLASWAASIPAGDGYQVVRVKDFNLEVFTYKPANYNSGPLLMVFHGVERDADTYRDNSKGMADRFGMVVAAPLFDKSRFPSALYQQGGVANKKALQPQEKWIGTIAIVLVDQLRRDEGKPDLDYYLIGHSAGGQFLARLAPFTPNVAKRIVATNPSSWVFPTLKGDFPFGLGGATASLANDDFLKRYLAAPLTVYLGQADTGDRNRDDSEDAVEQGAHRYERGMNFFKAGQALAKEKGWPLNWRLVEVPKVGHSSRRMFDAPQAKAALFGD